MGLEDLIFGLGVIASTIVAAVHVRNLEDFMRLRADRRVERREEAVERSKAWEQLSTKEKLESIRRRRGQSRRQLKKLEGGKEDGR